MLAAYETQAAAVAATKAAGLRRHYGIDGPGVAFWDVHADLEADHADWTASALAATAASPAQVTSAAADGARAWSQFLDERQTTAQLTGHAITATRAARASRAAAASARRAGR